MLDVFHNYRLKHLFIKEFQTHSSNRSNLGCFSALQTSSCLKSVTKNMFLVPLENALFTLMWLLALKNADFISFLNNVIFKGSKTLHKLFY